MQELNVDLAGQPHQAHSLVLDLSHECAVVRVLCSDQLGNEVFAIGFGHGLTLAVKNVGQIIVVFLLGVADFHVGEHEHAGGEEGLRTWMDAADFLEDVTIMAGKLLKVVL